MRKNFGESMLYGGSNCNHSVCKKSLHKCKSVQVRANACVAGKEWG